MTTSNSPNWNPGLRELIHISFILYSGTQLKCKLSFIGMQSIAIMQAEILLWVLYCLKGHCDIPTNSYPQERFYQGINDVMWIHKLLPSEADEILSQKLGLVNTPKPVLEKIKYTRDYCSQQNILFGFPTAHTY